MTIAQVVPLRRFPSDRQWFDYLVPPELPIQTGHLVEVPFLRQQVPGVVWNMADSSAISRLKNVTKLLRPEPVMTDWQRLVCSTIAEQSCVSLGHVLDSVIPNFPRRKTTIRPAGPAKNMADIKMAVPPKEQTWWYRQRRDARSWIKWWLTQDSAVARLVMVPTVEDGQEIMIMMRQTQPDLVFVHGLLNRTNYADIYEGVRQGRIRHIIGTGRGLTLPYPAVPMILIDQEEHPSHKQTEQQPRTDYRRILEILQADVQITTPAPSVRWCHLHHPEPPPPGRDLRQLADLGQTRRAPWLTNEGETLIENARTNHQPLLLIAPQHGYASSISCRDCHLTVDCAHCHQRLRLFRQTNEVVCRNCGQTQRLPATCPRCHGARWAVHGWGVEYIAEQLKQMWPDIMVAIEDIPVDGADIVLDTYRGYRQAGKIHNLGGIIIVNGDALLNYPDFSVAERAWQYLARLQAQAPEVPVMVQTFTPSGDFWQRWRRWDDAAWYADELAVRQRHGLPPITDQWIARYPGQQPSDVLQKKIAEIKDLQLETVTIVSLPAPSPKQIASRILLTSTGRLLAKRISGRNLFPYPWQVDTSVASWLA